MVVAPSAGDEPGPPTRNKRPRRRSEWSERGRAWSISGYWSLPPSSSRYCCWPAVTSRGAGTRGASRGGGAGRQRGCRGAGTTGGWNGAWSASAGCRPLRTTPRTAPRRRRGHQTGAQRWTLRRRGFGTNKPRMRGGPRTRHASCEKATGAGPHRGRDSHRSRTPSSGARRISIWTRTRRTRR